MESERSTMLQLVALDRNKVWESCWTALFEEAGMKGRNRVDLVCEVGILKKREEGEK